MKMVTVHSNTSLFVYTRLAQVVYFIGRLNIVFINPFAFYSHTDNTTYDDITLKVHLKHRGVLELSTDEVKEA